jgi:hypothetical protein
VGGVEPLAPQQGSDLVKSFFVCKSDLTAQLRESILVVIYAAA